MSADVDGIPVFMLFLFFFFCLHSVYFAYSKKKKRKAHTRTHIATQKTLIALCTFFFFRFFEVIFACECPLFVTPRCPTILCRSFPRQVLTHHAARSLPRSRCGTSSMCWTATSLSLRSQKRRNTRSVHTSVPACTSTITPSTRTISSGLRLRVAISIGRSTGRTTTT